jgi:transposase
MLLWGEYKRSHPEGYQYSWFCERYRSWAAKIDVRGGRVCLDS